MSISSCYYLFNRDAKELFPKQDEPFVNESLTTLIHVIDHLVLTNREALFTFDPMAFNDQCHLYALFASQVINGSQNVDRRFLYLTFFLSHAFLNDSKLLDRLVCKTLTVMNQEAPSQPFRLFVKDPEAIRTHASRSALNQLFSNHMKKIPSYEEGSLSSELSKIAQADLQLPPSNKSESLETLYTFPKFAAVAYFLDTLTKEKIALLFKVKVMTKEGNGTFSFSNQNIKALEAGSPVIVFEMVATGESLSYVECHDIAKRCPSHSRRNVTSKARHKPAETCLFCSPKKIDVTSYHEKFQPVLARTEEMLYALGADFVLQKQTPFLPFFSDKKQFPKLTTLFETNLPAIKTNLLSMTEPMNMTVSHTHIDCAARACEDSLLLDAAYETHLKARELI